MKIRTVDLNLLKREIETDNSRVRVTRTKLSILGQYKGGKWGENIEIFKKKRGVQIKWSGHILVDAQETQTCDLGHEHKVLKDQHWVWNYSDLTDADIAKIVEFFS